MAKKPQSARELMRAAQQALNLARKAEKAVSASDVEAKRAALEVELAALDAVIKEAQTIYDDAILNHDTAPVISAKLSTLNSAKAKRGPIVSQIQSLGTTLTDVSIISETESAIEFAVQAATVTTTALGTYGQISNPAFLGLNYNASATKDASFSTRASFLQRIMPSHNQASAVSTASALWSTAAGSKGMIVMSEQVLKAWNSGGARPGGAGPDPINYGFQFQYNPGTVAMSYFTSPNVDVTMMTSGTEMFNLAGVSGSQGSVSFQIIINRIFDMQYITPSGTLKTGLSAKDVYSKPPTTTEIKDIYNKGTMYDIEYLLRVLMGTTMKSYLRGDNTADMGWLPAMPVELHLGNNLRYLGTVNSVNLNHIIFNERMVPLFTTVDIAFARLPDYPGGTTTPTGTGGTGNQFAI